MLRSVRGEPARGAQAQACVHRWAIAGGAALVAAIAVIATFAIDQGPTPPAKVRRGTDTAHASLRRIGSHAELVVSGMPEPPIGEVYELWLNRANGAPQPTDALFTVTRAGTGSVAVPGPLRGVREVMVTSEPLGGSSSPTSAAVLRLRVHP